ncbi:MAG: sulfate adenylyltransferase [Coriobacteriaceae bacterium]|nr:MAG: sulfate adenylyltransferase [Coriobacteriaceae bacterium]
MRDLLKFITCGSVDDGKSTLIGHLLYDSKLIYADQARALELDSKVGSRGGAIDYSLLLDGLSAEREQGITIDVAYRYFTTDRRSFIVADTPGHEEYTRNMAVGASFADLAVILVDASKGLLPQTRRHARICALVGIRSFVFAINKMDLVGYSEETFHEIEQEVHELAHELGLAHVTLIPVSATEGDNITTRSENTPWYEGLPLLGYLETVDADTGSLGEGFYLPVQRVSRPDHTFRGFQGQVEADEVSVGDELTVLPSGEHAHVKSILVAGSPEEKASFGDPATIQLDREVDVSRGCVLERGAGLKVASSVLATVLWMDDKPLSLGRDFYVLLGTKEIPGALTSILYAIDVNTGERKKADRLSKNEIAVVQLAFTEPIVVDEFKRHRTMGELILIDRITNATSACGVVERVDDQDAGQGSSADSHLRMVLKGHAGITVEFPLASGAAADTESGTFTLDQVKDIEHRLVAEGLDAYLYQPGPESHPAEVVAHLNRAGVTVLLALAPEVHDALPRRSDNLVFRGWQAEVGTDPAAIADYVRRMSASDAAADLGASL